MRKNIIVAMASLAFLPAVSFAAAPTLSDVLDASGITVTGHASGSYAYEHTGVDGSASTASNQFTFDQAELTVSKLPTDGFGALVDVFAGQDVAGGTYNYGGTGFYPTGAFNAFGSTGQDFNLHQAYVQYASGAVTVIGGKFATLAGYEVASDAMNTMATRSILFALQPFTLTGVRASYKFSDMVTAYVGLSNNSGSGIPGLAPAAASPTVSVTPQKTTELAVALAPLAGLTVNLTDYIGVDSGIRRNTFDLVTAYTAGSLTLGLNGDLISDKSSPAGTVDAKAQGLALYANYQITPVYSAGLRGEIVQIKDDLTSPSTTVNAKELTLSGGYAATKNFNLLTDVRFAHASGSGLGGVGNETTAVVKAVYKF